MTPALPSTKEQEQQLATIQSNYIDVVDRESHDTAIENIKAAAEFTDGVKVFFAPFEKPFKDAMAAMETQKKSLIDPAVEYQREHRLRCKNWQIKELEAAEKTRLEALERARNAAPWEEASEVPEPANVSPSGAGLRNKPWQVKIDDEDALWQAAIKDRRYREYWVVDIKALTAKARSQQEAFNVPGVSIFREKTLSIRG